MNKKYADLKESKICSNYFPVRGTQSLNLAQKSKNEVFYGFTQENKEEWATASNWNIDNASKGVKINQAKQQEKNYLKSIDDIMLSKLKKPGNFSMLRSLLVISIMDSEATDMKKRGTTSNKSKIGSKGQSA